MGRIFVRGRLPLKSAGQLAWATLWRGSPANNHTNSLAWDGAGAVARDPQGGTRVREALYQTQSGSKYRTLAGVFQDYYGAATRKSQIVQLLVGTPAYAPSKGYLPANFDAQTNTAVPAIIR